MPANKEIKAARGQRTMLLGAILLSLLLTATLSGCLTSGELSYSDYLYERTYKTGVIAEHLITSLSPPHNSHDTVIVVTSFVTLADFSQTSHFGMVMGEQMLSRLAALGFRVRETRLKDIFYQGKNGEFVLTREFTSLAHEMKADLVLVGTYMETRNNVLINTRLVDFKSNEVVSSFDCQLAKNEDIIELLVH
ncbi:MAG: hypothetical protein JXO49_06945 [Deltaproteobacteria bacterium]|nr:hypothetical protein [Candidatus Anaeroferrophillus wilburensis]MBN2889064.1 hypothetical protein [Deltaproteobacteria bacterium]